MESSMETGPPYKAAVITDPVPRTLTPIPETETEPQYPITCTFHPDADLKVTIHAPNADPVVYMVCASALSCASRQWRRMLYSNAAEAQGNQEKDEAKPEQVQTLKLEGNAEALGIIFRIVHYDFIYVPQEPTVDQLFELSKSACRYNCIHILYPWACQWTAQLENFTAHEDCAIECHKPLYIGWAFGDLQLYRDAIDTLIVSSRLNVGGKVVNKAGQALEDMSLPPYALAIITEVRETTVAQILGAVKAPIDELSSGDHGRQTSYCRVGKDTEECETMMLGSAVSALTKARLFPIPDAKAFTGSIEDLKDGLEGIKLIPYIGREWMPHMSHGGCNLGFAETIMDCLKKMMVPLSSGIMAWISDQADMCGIGANDELKKWRLKSGTRFEPSKEAYISPEKFGAISLKESDAMSSKEPDSVCLPEKQPNEGNGSDSGNVFTKEEVNES
ncbi:hypothetical protein F4861DRAFT_518720 [Xylaria intraflava]|nr:hypothetical protein F4861DRAFT_518720 [Xylaria intraflava]